MANYVKFKQGLKKDFNTTNQPLTNGMIYFVIDENNNGSIYYDTVVDGKTATKTGTVHRVKFSGLPIKIIGSVTGTGVISQDGETIEINTSTNHSHGLAHQDFTVKLSNDDTNLKWTRLGNQNGGGFWLKSIRGQSKAPAWFLPDYSAGIAFGGENTKGIISVKYNQPGVRFAGGNGDAPVWYFTITGANDKTYDLSKIGGHSSDSAKLDHNVTFKIASTADATNGANGTKTDLSGPAVNLYLPTKISGFDLLQASRFQGNADSATYATSAGYAKGLFLNPETRQEDMNFNLADAKYIKRVTYSMATSTTKKNKPPIGDANILSFGWDNSGYGSQLAIQNGSAGHLAVRGSGSNNGASSWGEWSTVLDSSNYTSYINNYYWANVKVSTASSTETKPTFNTAYTSNWWRSTGKTGWWNDTYSGGIAMEDKTYVKVAGNKSFLIPNGSLKIGGNGDIFFATGDNDATLKVYGQTNTKFGIETIAIQTCFDNEDPQTSGYTTQYANRCNLLLQPRGGQVYIGKNLTTPGDTGYKLLVDGNQWTSGSQWVNGNLLFTDITGNTTDTGMSLKGIYGCIGGNDGWRIAGGARAGDAGYLEIATCDDMDEPIYVRQYGSGGSWNGYVSLARTFTLLDAAGRSRAPELFEAKKVHINSLLDQSVAIADISYQFQVTGTSNFTDSVDISGVTTHHNNIQIDANYSIAKPGKNSAWYGSHNNAMIRMTSVNSWSPLLAQKVTNGYWVLGHYDHYNEKDEKDKNSDFRNQWVFGYLADSNLEGTTGASNSLSTTYRLLNIGGNENQRMFVSAKYNATVGSGTQPVYVQSNGNVATCSYSLSATIEAGTANRMAYYKAANQIGSSGHYVTSSQVGINSNTTHDFTFYVGGNSYFSNLVTVYAGNNLGVKIGNTNITAIDGSLIFQNNTALRFGSSEWDWNKWAGLKYVPDSKTIVMGLADSTNFTANAVQSGGTFLFTGMSSIDLNKTASIKNLAVGGGIYWNPYVESVGDGSDAASITVIAHGAADGTELRIQQQNDANDIINLVVNNSIFLNGKRAFRPFDDWLRINEDSSFNYGIYTGSSLIRSDNQLQVGDGGNAFYANSAGNGYLSNNLIIRGIYAVNFLGAGDQTYTQSAFIINNTNGFVIETPRSTNEITTTNILPFRIRTRGGQPAPEFAGDRLVENNCIYNLGSKTAEFAKGFIRTIAARHLDADAVYSGDHTLYIGWGNAAYTEKTAFFYSPNLSSRTQFAEINSNGLYALTRFGVNGQNTSYTCYINGTLFSGTHTVYGRADSNTAPSNFYYNGALEIRESNLVTNNASASSFNYAPRIGFHWGGRIAASLSFHNDGIFYFRKQDGNSRATIDANVNGLATNASNSTNAEYVSNESAYMRFHWNGQSGQPKWLWGGNEAGHMYVYNPSNFSVNYANSAGNADKLDNYHASEVYKAATHTINNYSSVNDWVRIATINIGGTGLSMGGFTAILSNRECLDGSSFILTVAIRRNSVTSVSCQAFYTPIGSSSPREIIIRSNDGVNFYVYFKSVLNSWTTYYNVTKIMTENNVTFENIGVSSANLITGSVLNVIAVKGGFVDRATDADTVDGYHANAFVKKAGDTMTGHLNSNSEFITTSYNGFRISAASSTNTKSIILRNDGSDFYILCCNSAAAGNNWYIPTGGAHPLRINLTTGYSYFSKVYGAVWNDYAEYRSTSKVKPGQCVIETGLGDLIQSTKRLQPGANIVSDTFGFAIGKTEQTKTPIAVSGRVLAYPYEDRDSYQAGDPVCSGPNGTISKMTREEVREYPDRIIGTVSEIPDYEVWGTGNVKVNNRIWIKVK